MRAMARLLLLHGPNLNLLGTREPDIYGCDTLTTINNRLINQATQLNHTLSCFQSNAESALVDQIHHAQQEQIALIIINPAALTHTSVSLRDALLATAIPFIEVHLSNTAAREDFRQHSFFADCAVGSITGFGSYSYDLALRAAHHHLTQATGTQHGY